MWTTQRVDRTWRGAWGWGLVGFYLGAGLPRSGAAVARALLQKEGLMESKEIQDRLRQADEAGVYIHHAVESWGQIRVKALIQMGLFADQVPETPGHRNVAGVYPDHREPVTFTGFRPVPPGQPVGEPVETFEAARDRIELLTLDLARLRQELKVERERLKIALVRERLLRAQAANEPSVPRAQRQ